MGGVEFLFREKTEHISSQGNLENLGKQQGNCRGRDLVSTGRIFASTTSPELSFNISCICWTCLRLIHFLPDQALVSQSPAGMTDATPQVVTDEVVLRCQT